MCLKCPMVCILLSERQLIFWLYFMSGREELFSFKKIMKLRSWAVYKIAIKELLKAFERGFVGVMMLRGEREKV